MTRWTLDDLPSQRGRLAVVTGANSGIGYQTAVGLAAKGARVVLACRNPDKAAGALARLRAAVPDAQAELAPLDVSDLRSVRAFAASFLARGEALDVLVNNAGIMAPLSRKTTAEGFELQMATNHLGHFALTALLVPALRRAEAPRVVPVASIAHKRGRLDFDDLMSARRYVPWAAYARTKLANLLFAFELQRRADAAGWPLRSVAAHPGVARTRIVENGLGGGRPTLLTRLTELVWPLFSHSEEQGALPILYAAGMPDAAPGGYYGPHGFREMTGFPVPVMATARARDEADARRLWDASERLTGIPFPLS
ncbi:MAG: SDR family oxidoreductase [Elusimicrobia bacterium]|nr:SDR family oxidoreductase [Elusimicrobiota bacterium]